MPDLAIGGFVPLSGCDWPGELVATVFCQGCPWRCPYCHNPHLVAREGARQLAWPDILAQLNQRRGLLDGVVFSGGEPTLQAALPEAVRSVRSLGFRVGLHTAGAYPEALEDLLPLFDWIGFDVKGPFPAYEAITAIPGSGERAERSLRHVLASGVGHEVRTTFLPPLSTEADLRLLLERLPMLGVTHYAIQIARSPTGTPAVGPEALEPLLRDYRSRFADLRIR